MKTQAELIESRKVLLEEMRSIITAGKAEKRKLSAVEVRAFDAAKAQIDDIDKQLTLIPTGPGPQTSNKRMKTNETNFSLLKAIRAAANKDQFDEATLAFIEAGRAEMRKNGFSTSGNLILPFEHRATIQATTATSGQEVVSEQKLSIIEPLRASLVTVQAGATFLNGLVGDVSIPTYAGTTAAWKGEGITATDGAGATGEKTMSPKRLTTYIDISKQFLLQDSANAEALLMSDIVAAIRGKLEGTIFGKEAGSSTQPAGFFASAPSIKGTATWANMVDLEAAVDTANALGTAKYITNAAGRALLKKAVKVANQATYLMAPDGTLNGYPVLVTNHVASALQTGADEYGIVFGDWSQLLIGAWGAMDITVDPYTRATYSEVRVTINAYFDAIQRRTEAFKTGSMK